MNPLGNSASLFPRAIMMLVAVLGVGACSSSLQSPPAIQNNGSSMTPLVVGHRGASGYRPEHTLESYRLAVEQGADYIEPDLVITADDVLIARHENEIGGTTDVSGHPEFASRRTTKTIDGNSITGWFTEDFTLAELKTLRTRERIPRLRPANVRFNDLEIPTLDEVLELVHSLNEERAATARAKGEPTPAPIGIYPETKHPTYFRMLGKPLEEPVLEALGRADLDNERAPVFIQSFETSNLRMLKGKTRVRLIQLVDDTGAPFDLAAAGDSRTYADLVTPAGLADIATYAYGIGAAKELLIPHNGDGSLGTPTSLVREAHARGLQVHAWTFRAENQFLPTNLQSSTDPSGYGALEQEIAAYLRTGIDGFFSDHPDIAVRSVRRHRSDH